MPGYPARAPARFEATPFALHLALALAIALGLAAWGGRALVEALLPLAAKLLVALDDRFTVLALGIDDGGQDTVVRLRCNLRQAVLIGGQLTYPHPRGWLEVTTTVWVLFQPLVLAAGLAWALPAPLATRALRAITAAAAGLAFLVLDLPVTLHAYVWDMFRDAYLPDSTSPLLMWHGLMHGGGRAVVGVVTGLGTGVLWRVPGRGAVQTD